MRVQWDRNQLFMDYKKAYISIRRELLQNAPLEFCMWKVLCIRSLETANVRTLMSNIITYFKTCRHEQSVTASVWYEVIF
jgi:hypothetical protein